MPTVLPSSPIGAVPETLMMQPDRAARAIPIIDSNGEPENDRVLIAAKTIIWSARRTNQSLLRGWACSAARAGSLLSNRRRSEILDQLSDKSSRRRQLARSVTGVDGLARLEQQQRRLARGTRL